MSQIIIIALIHKGLFIIAAINYVDTISNAGKYYGFYLDNHYELYCASSVQNLSNCSWSNYGYNYSYTLGVKCAGNYLYIMS